MTPLFAQHAASMITSELVKIDFQEDPHARVQLVSEITLDLPLLYRDAPPHDFLVNQLLPANGIVAVVGKPSSGKSWIVYDLIRAVSTGTPWLARSALPHGGEPRPCVLFDFDNGWGEVAARFRALGIPEGAPVRVHTEGIEGPLLRFPIPRAEEPEEFDAVVEQVCAVIDETQARVAVFDSLRQSHLGDENSSKDMAELMAAFKRIARPHGKRTIYNVLIVLVHHTAKTGWLRGSSEIEGSTSVVLKVKKERTKEHGLRNVIEWEKTRGWDGEGRTVAFELTPKAGDAIVVRALGKLPGASPPRMPTLAEHLDHLLAWLREQGATSSKNGADQEEAREATNMTRPTFRAVRGLGIEEGRIGTTKPVRESRKTWIYLT